MSSQNVEVIPIKHGDTLHIDGKAKRMQVFLKKISRSKSSPLSFNFTDKIKSSPAIPTDVTTATMEKEKRPEKNELELLRQYEKDVKSVYLSNAGVIAID